MHCYRGRDPITLQHLEVEVDGGAITAVRPWLEPSGDLWLAAGLVDLQVNGYGGIDLNADGCDVAAITRMLEVAGTTTFLPTIITADIASMSSRLRAIANACAGNSDVARAIPCIHVEGPYISPEDGYRGAHPVADVRPPSLEEFDVLQSAADGLIGLVTLSPHWPGVEEFIRALHERGVVVSLGHTDASPDQIHHAVDAGATLSTHLGNGLAAVLPRHNNPIFTQLAEDRLTAAFIVDGAHLPTDTLRVMLRAKGVERSILVSDSVALGGVTPGHYHSHIGGEVTVHADGTIRMREGGLLAGSRIMLKDAVGRMSTMSGCTLGQAIRMATSNPADALGLKAGRIVVGAPADLLLFRWKRGDTSLQVEEVVIRGEQLA
ncbi:N-acetylglucosamine-6-phosphate deacetylase [Terriglobus roseus]|uniref:N-acetylglucosamine-6-phosphate deacetylase n=1 Tax=Terriglobus roseus TaxID=392734 RepID=A0A1G7H6L8_9BACT|nr:amidohydrolase family protein [Terriglobus roseus]SDE96046.1 N-acetylglucosamine-6-phosphate deacetylase [Terriglobus roseus]